MFVKQLYTNCLSEAAYYIESEKEAAVIDPLRETEPYITLAKERGATIKYVFETHFHADFISGHIDLAAKTNSTIVFGPGADTVYKSYNAKDGEVFSIGKIKLKVLHTPGHTPESSCYLLIDENGKEYAVFTGDTLFVGDVGRPDLLDGKMSKEELAGMMYDSLNQKIKKLPDPVIVYPAHGPGSLCGKNLGKETWSTIGEQRKTNYALADMPREQFIKVLTEDLLPPPAYFFTDARINREGYENIDQVIDRNLKPLTAGEAEEKIKQGARVLDVRSAGEFAKIFIPGSINIGLDGSFAVWAGTLIDHHIPLVLVTPNGREREAVLRLARVGYENVAGVLEGGVDEWKNNGKPVDSIRDAEPADVNFQKRDDLVVLDVRNAGEVKNGAVKDSVNIPLSDLPGKISTLNPQAEYLVHCAGGYRSMVASSLLKAAGFSRVTNIRGGYEKIKPVLALPL